MTALAGRKGMQSVERELGQIVIETNLTAPALGHVAGVALLPQFAPVNIIWFMAVDTLTHRDILANAACMTGIAGCFFMRAAEGKLGVLVVVETCFSPVAATMTILAAVTVASLVRVISAMTVNAGGGEFLCLLAREVTSSAGDIVMCTTQDEICFVVIEFYCGPLGAAVAAFALVTIAAAMDIVAVMA